MSIGEARREECSVKTNKEAKSNASLKSRVQQLVQSSFDDQNFLNQFFKAVACVYTRAQILIHVH